MTFTIIIRALNIAEYGTYAFYINAIFFVTILLDLGATEVVLRFIPEYIAHKEANKIKILFRSILLFVSAAGLILFLISVFIFLFFSFKITAFTSLSRLFPFVIIFGWLRILTIIFGNILNAYCYQAYRITAETVISCLKLFFVWLLATYAISSWSIVLTYAFFDIVTVIIFYTKIKENIAISSEKTSKDNPLRILKFVIHEYFYKVFWFFTDNRFDIYLAGYLCGVDKAGYLAFAASIVNMLIDWSPGFIIRPVIAPLFVREYALKKDIVQIGHLFRLHNKILVFIALPLFTLLAILIDKIIMYIFDPKYLPSVNVFLIFICSMFFINLIIPLRNIVTLMERPDISNLSNISAIPKIALIFIYARIGGVCFIAAAYAVSLFFIFGLHIVLLKKVIPLNFPWTAFGKIAVNSAIMGCLLFFLKSFVVNKVSLIITSIAGIGAYFTAAYINKAFSDTDRKLFNVSLGLNIWKF